MRLTRRRFIAISAAVIAAPVEGLTATVATETFTWRGVALGASASITLSGLQHSRLQKIAGSLESEISRLEDIFSLYRPDSAISRLNRDGQITNPPPEMLQLLSLVRSVHARSLGAFDPTVQNLWRFYTDTRGDRTAQDRRQLSKIRELTGWRYVRYSPESVSFLRSGMEMTLNGIAQGFVADRVANLLRREGLTNVLIDMGEISAQGLRPTGDPWRVGINAPDGHIVKHVGLSNRALATSSPKGGVPEDALHAGHIIDPRTGAPGGIWNLVSVSDERAVVADALSTAICLLDRDSSEALIKSFPEARLEHLS